MGKYIIEHWRDGELFEKVELTKDMFKHLPDGSTSIILPPGCITLATKDKLHFYPEIRELL